ncbi:right-handed parallel beta-helix repeat-containing protein [Natronomonas sp.]|uniref:right-handed parallel beta-helix repeat-containing protein n=1 Tax=Natronomonas sp. TaxID=2184060 RepID=UPI003974B225
MTHKKRILVIASAITALVLLGVAGFAGGAVAQESSDAGETYAVGSEDGADFTTLQDALESDDIESGDTIQLQAETHTVDSQLEVRTDDLTIEGAGTDETTIESTSTGYGLLVRGENVELSGFTLSGPGAESDSIYGVKIDAADLDEGRLDQVSVTDVTIEDWGRSGLDLNAVTNANLNEIEVRDNGGVGVAFTDVTSSDVSQLSTSNNAWGGVAVFANGALSDQLGDDVGSYDIAFTDDLHAGEDTPLYIQAADRDQIEDINLPGNIQYRVTAETSNTLANDAAANEYEWYFAEREGAVDTAIGKNEEADTDAAVVHDVVDDRYVVDEGLSIQTAIDSAGNGATIDVFPGTYEEIAENRDAYGTDNQPYSFGLYVGTEEVTIRGVSDAGEPVSDDENVEANVISQASSDFGTNGPFIAADSVTIQGIEITPNPDASPNKNLEIAGDDFTLADSVVNGEIGSVYFNSGDVQTLSVTGNEINAGLSFNDGAGNQTDATNRLVRNNEIGLISFAGEQEDVDWRNYAVGSVTIEDNEIEGHQYTLTYEDDNGDEQTYVYDGIFSTAGELNEPIDWTSIAEENTIERGVLIPDEDSSTGLKDTADGTEGYSVFYDVESAIEKAESGDTIVVRSGTYEESIKVDVDGITVQAAEDSEPEIIAPEDAGIGGSDTVVEVSADNVRIEGLSIYADLSGVQPTGLRLSGNNVEAIDNDLERADASGNPLLGGGGDDATVAKNDLVGGPIGLGSSGEVNVSENTIEGDLPDEAIWSSGDITALTLEGNDIEEAITDAKDSGSADIKVVNEPDSVNGNEDVSIEAVAGAVIGDNTDIETVELWNGQTYDENGNIVVQEGDSIQDAIDNAGEDETIVLDGEFEEDVTIDQPGLTIEGTDDATIVGQSTGGALEIAADDVSVSGLAVDATGKSAVYVRSGTEGFHLTDSTIRTAPSPDGRPNGLLFETGGTDNHHIEGNTFENEADGSENPILAYVNGEVSGPSESTNVSFVDNTFTGDSVGGGLALGHEAADSEITGNTFEVNSDYGQLEVWAADTEIADNEFDAAAGFHIRDAGDNIDDGVVSANDFERAVFVDETSDGSQKVFGTLQSALADTAEGATVSLTADVFDGAATIDTADITIEGRNADLAADSDDRSDETTLAVNGYHEIAAEGVTIDGLHYEINGPVNGVEVTADSATIKNSVFEAPDVDDFASRSGYEVWIDGASDTTIESNQFTGGNGAIQIAGKSVDTNIENNVIDSDVTGIGQGSATQDAVTETTIEDNTITVGVQAISGWKADDMVVEANTIVVDDAAYEGRSAFTTERGIDISGDNVSVTENDISSTDTAVLVGSDAGSDIEVNQNNLAGDEFAVDASSYTETLDATRNYWGDKTGPSDEGPGDGDAVSENVDIAPWLNAPYPDGQPTRPTAFEVTNFEVDTDQVPVGERITAELTVENTGDVAGVKPISIEAGGETIQEFGVEDRVALGSGATFTREVTFAPGSEGDLELTVDATDDDSSETISVVQSETTFEIQESDITSDDETLPGEEVSVSATVTNSGTAEGTRTVVLERGGETVDAVDATLDPEESMTVELTDIPSASLTDSETTYEVGTPTSRSEAGTITILEPATVDITKSNLGDLDSVVAGETTTVEATVKNDGGAATSETVQLTADGSTVAETDVEVPSGESVDVTLDVDTADLSAGTHDLALRTSDDTASETDALEVRAPAEFVPTIESVTDPEAGKDIEVEVKVTNVGGETASDEVELVVPGIGAETVQTGDLSSDESETVTLTVETDEDAIGEGSLFVATDDETADGETEVLAAPELDVAIESATDPLVAEQDTLAVDVAVENEGDVEASDIELTLGLAGENEATETVTVEGDSERTVTFDGIDVGEGLEGDLELDATATYDGTTVDDTETVTVLEAPEDAVFRVSEFTVTDNTPRDDVLRIDSGTIEVEATIENVGDLEGTQEVPLLIDGEPVTTENSLTLEGGESTTGEFTIDANELRTGDRTIAAETDDSDRTSTVTVRDPEPATFEVELDDTDSLERGDTVEATVENVGDVEGTQSTSVEIYADGEQLTTSDEDVTLGVDETATIDASIPDAPRAGEFEATIEAETDDATDSSEATVDFGSMENALAAAESGDTVHVAPGDYDDEVTLDESDITLSGDGATLTSSGTAVSIEANDVTVEGFDFDGADVGVQITGDDATVRTSRFVGSVTNGTEVRATGATIENNRFDGLSDTAVVLTGDADDATIVDNNILDGHLGIYADAGFHVVENNNIEQNSHAAIDADRPNADSITEIDATDNYWGRPGGPLTDEILSPVTTEPFLTEPNEEPDYRVADSTLDSIDQTVEGEPVEVTYTVKNHGGTAGSDIADTLVLTLDGQPVAETDAFEIGAGQSLSSDDAELDALTFEVDASTAARLDTASLELSTDDDASSESVEVLTAAEIESTITDAPDELEADQTLSVEATIENSGQANGAETVELHFDGTVVDSEEVTLAGGSDTTVTLSTELDESDIGTDILIDVLPTDTQYATVTVEEATDPAPVGSIGGGSSLPDSDGPDSDDSDSEPDEPTDSDEPTDDTSGSDGPDSDSGPDADTSTESDTPEPDSEPEQTPVDEPAELPGFGAGVAIIALLAAALMARYRR